MKLFLIFLSIIFIAAWFVGVFLCKQTGVVHLFLTLGVIIGIIAVFKEDDFDNIYPT